MTDPSKPRDKRLILWFKELRNEDVGLVGGKNASLGEMLSQLTGKGVKVPNGYAVTAYAYHHVLIEKKSIELTTNQALLFRIHRPNSCSNGNQPGV